MNTSTSLSRNSSEESVSLTTPPLPEATFTMIFIDFDDTLIPTSIRQLFSKNMGLDIFELLRSSEIKKLQFSIIKSLEKIYSYFNSSTNPVKICIVSNATQSWLNSMFRSKYNDKYGCKIPPKFSILGKYLKQKSIEIVSAVQETFAFLRRKVGDEQAKEMIVDSKKQNKMDRWMLKYTAFSSKICKYKKELNMKCKRIISFGDGDDEFKALNYFSKTWSVESLHIQFLSAPTFPQLHDEWKYIEQNINKIIFNNEINKKICTHSPRLQPANDFLYVHDLNTVISSDNNKLCTGPNSQMPEIAVYFQFWMTILDDCDDDLREQYIDNVCQKVYQSVHLEHHVTDPTRVAFKHILSKCICRNENFSNALISFYSRKKK